MSQGAQADCDGGGKREAERGARPCFDMFWPFLGPFPRGLKKHEKYVKHDFHGGDCRIVQAALADEGGFGFTVGTITLNQGSGFILIIYMSRQRVFGPGCAGRPC